MNAQEIRTRDGKAETRRVRIVTRIVSLKNKFEYRPKERAEVLAISARAPESNEVILRANGDTIGVFDSAYLQDLYPRAYNIDSQFLEPGDKIEVFGGDICLHVRESEPTSEWEAVPIPAGLGFLSTGPAKPAPKH